ncbi:MAG: acetamidase/formamidase family protein [Bryobacteraceae bacterium]|nr:acetamidase/formamidase family protein [Bryobacteraceae bacterium]
MACWFLILLLASVCGAETYRVEATKFYNSFHHRHTVLQRIRSGDTVTTKTIDASGRDHLGKVAGSAPNPLTGPFYVEGAVSGDAIAVTFRRIRMNRDWGWSAYRLGLFSMAAPSIENLYPNSYKAGAAFEGRSNIVPWDLDLNKNLVRLREPASKSHRMEFPARPMLGCVGVAAAGDFGPGSGISGPYGGNMDYNEVVEGATVVLPVFHDGALLFLGDGHALQGDGEPTGTGVETSMDVEFTVELRKKAGLSNPRLEKTDFIVSVGSQPEFASSLDRALQIATSDMADWLTRSYGLEPWAAHLLIGYQGRYDVITVAGSVGLRIPRKALPVAGANPSND